jgi:hypothetical protein
MSKNYANQNFSENLSRSEKDLKNLKGFCLHPRITGHIQHMWFHGLRCRYPKEFLEYTNDNKFHPYLRMQIMEKLDKSISLKFKNREELITTNWDELTLEEKAFRSYLELHPNLGWEVAIS